MKITEIIKLGDYEQEEAVELTLETKEDKRTFYIGEGEPEDMTLSRDLRDALDVFYLIEMAYNAGKNGESLEIDRKTIDEWD